jgi:hypothetical protein
MKKTNYILRALTGVAIAIGLTACGGDGLNEALPEQTVKVPLRMAAEFNPSAGVLPLPNDLLFGGSTDLTLNIPGIADATDFSNPSVALSALDGWSSGAAFPINFVSIDPALSIDPSSVVGGSTVHVYKVSVDRVEVAPGIPGPTGLVTAVERELTAGLEYVVQAVSATSIAIIPTNPFEAQATYMVILTDGLMDSDGLPVLNDTQYAITKSPTPIDPTSSVAGLEAIRPFVNSMENAAAAFDGGPATSDIILSFQFTVQSVGNVMSSAKLAYIDGPLFGGATPALSFSSLMTNTTPFTGIGAADLYKGSIALTYLLGAPTIENPTAPLNVFWKALEELPLGPGGALVPNPFGDFLTYANSFPRANGVEVAPLLVALPNSGACAKPYKVAIFQHGITGNRTNALGIVDSLAANCIATVSMDLPIHGIDVNNPVHQGLQLATGGAIGLFDGYTEGGLRERTFGIDYLNNATGAPGPDGMADSSGAHTINLPNLLVSRDNFRQGVLDLLYLEKALGFMDVDGGGADFDTTNVYFIGQSLGSLVGTGVIAQSDVIKVAALSVPGGSIAQLLNNSESFGPIIKAGVAAGAGISTDDPAFPGILAQFMFVTQTVLDSTDPINVAALALTNNVPVMMHQVLNDTVIPNSVATSPLAGTIPLARVFQLTTVKPAEAGLVAGDHLFMKFNQGNHGSLIAPTPIVTAEMQTQVISFLLSGGTAVQITDPSLLDN